MLSTRGASRAMSGFLFGFEVAADFVLRWLRAEVAEEDLWIDLSQVATRRWRHDEFVDEADPARRSEGFAGTL